MAFPARAAGGNGAENHAVLPASKAAFTSRALFWDLGTKAVLVS